MLSGIALVKKQNRTFDFGKQDVADFTKFSNRNMCSHKSRHRSIVFWAKNFNRKDKGKKRGYIKFGKTHILSTDNFSNGPYLATVLKFEYL